LTKTGELTANKNDAEDVLYSDYVENKDLSQLYFISFQSKLADPKMNAIFDKMIAKKGFQKISVKNFYEIDNTLIYSIFRLKKG
jgi:hypothetical protein